MELRRAKQILSSANDITVLYHGQDVWIESVDEGTGMATVHMRGQHNDKQTVAIAELVE